MAYIEDNCIKYEKQLSCDQLLLEMEELYPTPKTIYMPDSLALSVKTMNIRALSSCMYSKQVIDFSQMKVREKKLSIVTQDVPEGILPKHFTAKLYDIRVKSKGPDDKIYSENADIRKYIPRGTTLMSLKEDDNEEVLDVVLYANKKFSGRIGDEDEVQPQNNEIWQKYCLMNIDNADTVVVMDKLNGEAAHLSGRFIDGKFYIITGSKNVHMLLSSEEDIVKYTGERYKVAIIIAKAVWELLVQMDQKCRKILFNLLHHTKCTLIFEILQPENQHIVNLAHLNKNELIFIYITPTFSNDYEISLTNDSATSLTALPPHHALDFFSALGCKTASYEIVEKDSVDEYNKHLRSLEEKEGHVLYYILKTDGHENTIGMVKVKTFWYVILRALREKVVFCFNTGKKSKGWSLEDLILATHRRFKDIQDWLKFDNQYLDEWIKVSRLFIQWLNTEVNNNRIIGADIRPKFPIILKNFQTVTEIAIPVFK